MTLPPGDGGRAGGDTPKTPRPPARPVRKRQRHNNRATKATQRIDYGDPDAGTKPRARPKGRSVGGPWIRKRK